MPLPEHERQEAEAAIETAYEALVDLTDVARDGMDEELEARASRIADAVNALHERL